MPSWALWIQNHLTRCTGDHDVDDDGGDHKHVDDDGGDHIHVDNDGGDHNHVDDDRMMLIQLYTRKEEEGKLDSSETCLTIDNSK